MARSLKQPSENFYGFPNPLQNLDLIPITMKRAPATTDIGYSIGQIWYDKVGLVEYVLSSVSAGSATWTAFSATGGFIATLTGSSGGALSPVGGTIIIAAGTNITSTAGSGHTITVNGSSTPTFSKVTLGTGAAGIVGTATLVPTAGGSTVVVSTTGVTASSKILISVNTLGGTPGTISAPSASIIAATSFVINSTSATDSSTVNWLIIN